MNSGLPPAEECAGSRLVLHSLSNQTEEDIKPGIMLCLKYFHGSIEPEFIDRFPRSRDECHAVSVEAIPKSKYGWVATEGPAKVETSTGYSKLLLPPPPAKVETI